MKSQLFEGAQFMSELDKKYLAVSSLGQSNVWTAVEDGNFANIVVLKAPSDDDIAGSWPAFQQEMVMHELFKNSKYIRKQVDRIAPVEERPPMLVLEIAEMTLWQARTKRPMSRGEIVAIMKGILQGLAEIHDQGLVYGDLKMENVMISGFDVGCAGDGSALEVKIGDLGTVSYPSIGTLQPLAYRAPEVYFRKEITPAADIWSAGLVYSHLVEAQSKFSETGIYDGLTSPSSTMDQRVNAVEKQMTKDFDLRNTDYYKGCDLPSRSETPTTGNHWAERGHGKLATNFLDRVMKADPRDRPTARAILESYWFKDGGLDDALGIYAENDVHDGAADSTADLAVRPAGANAALSSASPNVVDVLPLKAARTSSLKRRSNLVEPEPDDTHVLPVKKKFERGQASHLQAGGNTSRPGTYLSYR